MDGEAIEALRSVLETRCGVAETTGSKVREIAAALRAAGYVIERDWRPIEEAPSEGMFVYARPKGAGHYGIGLSYVSVSGKRMDAYGGGQMQHIGATHFIPLPKPPKE